MYIAIYFGEKSDGLENITAVSDVFQLFLKMLDEKSSHWADIVSQYDNREAFIADLDTFMGDWIEGYVIGVDVEGRNSFEILHVKYKWNIEQYNV